MNQKRKFGWVVLWSVLALICISYGMIVKALDNGTKFYLLWIVMGIGCVFLAVAAYFSLWKKLPSVLRKGILGVICLGIISFVGIEGCVYHGFFQQGEENLDYIIVLGAQVHANRPSTVLKYRLDRAIEYLEENPETICIVSGGQGANEPFPEAEGMADYMVRMGIPEERLILEKESTNTAENISNSMKFMDEDASVGIVTNNFHVFRGVLTAKREGLTNVCGIAANATKKYLPNNMLREYLAVIKFFLLG